MKGISSGRSLKSKATGMEASTPQMAPLLVAFFQNKPMRKTARMPGLTSPVYSWMYWNIWSMPPSIGASRTAIIRAMPALRRPTFTSCPWEAWGLM